MKILVLMPCDEQHVHAAAGVYKALPHELKEQCFPMPMFMDYLIQNKIVGNWIFSFFDTMLSLKSIYRTADENKDDLIVIGTAPKDFEFDAIFSFQEIDSKEKYKDNFLNKAIRPVVAKDEKLFAMVSNLYDVDDVQFALHNCTASADFLAAYIRTDVKEKLETLKKEYESKLEKGVIIDDVISSFK